MPYSRRKFLGGTARSAIAASVVLPPPLMTLVPNRPEPVSPIEDPRLKMLVDAGLNSALSSGASYADVRLTHTFALNFPGANIYESESITIGVRALVDGFWGFASSPIWNLDEASRLGRDATAQAKSGGTGKPRIMSLAPLASVASGHWTMPVQEDPFQIDRAEISDFLSGLRDYIRGLKDVSPNVGSQGSFVRQEKAFGSSDGAFCTQRIYRSEGVVAFVVKSPTMSLRIELDCLTPVGAGFELFRGQPLREICVWEHERAIEDFKLPLHPVDPGRFNMVLNARDVAKLISMTVGASTELDRALGYEANAGGTSFITDPGNMVGELKLGNSALHVTGNRSSRGSVATVQWDDDGVLPRDFTLVDNGILRGMQTDREGASWLAGNTAAVQQGSQSLGCASAPEAGFSPLTHSANLVLSPGENNLDSEGLIEGMGDGIAMRSVAFDLDFQRISGLGMCGLPTGRVYEIKNGKKIALIPSIGILFRTDELWKAIVEKGGKSETFGVGALKGEPSQSHYHSVSAVPMLFKELTAIDVTRKA